MGAIFDKQSGKLYLYSFRTTEVWAGWPAPMAWRKSESDAAWIHLRPHITLPKGNVARKIQQILEREKERPYKLHASEAELAEERAVGEKLYRLQWAQRIPDEVRRPISRFGCRQWHLLSMAARCGEAASDLIRANPALAFMLASNWVYHAPPVTQPLRSVRALLRRGKNQRDVLAWLGFPPRKAVQRVLARVPSASISISRLFYLRQACHEPQMLKAMCHLPRLNTGCLRILTDPRLFDCVSPVLLEDIAISRKEDRNPRSAQLLKDILRMLDELGRGVGPVRGIRRAENLSELHDELAERVPDVAVLSRSVEDEDALSFPREPVPGTDEIVPIREPAELRREAIEQKHCAWSYVRAVAERRDTYLYRVTAPERATLSLKLVGGSWRISELKGYRNARVGARTRAAVERWFHAYQFSKLSVDSYSALPSDGWDSDARRY